jgi:protein involved in polysaccharide export with SLBB domain
MRSHINAERSRSDVGVPLCSHGSRAWSRRLAVPCLLVALVAAPACGISGPGLVPSGELPAPIGGPYRVRVADVVEVAFFRTPELTQTRQVGPDGFISLNPVGRVQAAGMELDELTEQVRERYASQFDDPSVSISVVEYAGLSVFVGGEVNAAGMVPYHGGLTLVQALMEAGGPMPTARMDQILVIRMGADAEPVGTLVDVDRIFDDTEFYRDVALAPSDIVVVPRSRVATVNLFMEQFIRNNLPIPFALGYDVNRR